MPRDSSDFVDLSRSPSGLFTRQIWERASWSPQYEKVGEEEFALWVHAEAKTLAAQLDRLLPAQATTPLAKSIRLLTQNLWNDAEWARHQADGRSAEAA